VRANLNEVDLSKAKLIEADLRKADLRKADLDKADLRYANLREANLHQAYLHEANLSGTDLRKANLHQAHLSEVNLSGADLRKADLRKARLSEANLSGADLRKAHLSEADLSSATLVNTDLTGADLTGVSAWRLKLERTKQQNLIITPEDEPEITVDNIEVAQFVYLLLHNQKIRDVIDTIGKKAVLILGRFTADRKAVLDALREELRKRDYLPIMFDFDKPASQDLTATALGALYHRRHNRSEQHPI
jgi:hypothetical protein